MTHDALWRQPIFNSVGSIQAYYLLGQCYIVVHWTVKYVYKQTYVAILHLYWAPPTHEAHTHAHTHHMPTLVAIGYAVACTCVPLYSSLPLCT